MQDTRTTHHGLLLCLVLVALLAAAQHAKIEAQAARIVALEREVDGSGPG